MQILLHLQKKHFIFLSPDPDKHLLLCTSIPFTPCLFDQLLYFCWENKPPYILQKKRVWGMEGHTVSVNLHQSDYAETGTLAILLLTIILTCLNIFIHQLLILYQFII